MVFGRNLKASPSTAFQIVADCKATVVQSDAFGITQDGGVTPRMITLSPELSEDGDILNLTIPGIRNNPRSFTYEDIVSGQVFILPKRLNTVFSSRKASFRIEVADPANTIPMVANFIINWNFCPILALPSAKITTSSAVTPVVISSSMLLLTETHGLNVWELQWTLSTISGGMIEYYCPDNACDAIGQRWLPLELPATISHVQFS